VTVTRRKKAVRSDLPEIEIIEKGFRKPHVVLAYRELLDFSDKIRPLDGYLAHRLR
jgi:hypothetical protein